MIVRPWCGVNKDVTTEPEAHDKSSHGKIGGLLSC
jgi:hypothetical protein